MLSVCPSACLWHCIMAKSYIFQQKCLNKWMWSALIRTRFYNFQPLLEIARRSCPIQSHPATILFKLACKFINSTVEPRLQCAYITYSLLPCDSELLSRLRAPSKFLRIRNRTSGSPAWKSSLLATQSPSLMFYFVKGRCYSYSATESNPIILAWNSPSAVWRLGHSRNKGVLLLRGGELGEAKRDDGVGGEETGEEGKGRGRSRKWAGPQSHMTCTTPLHI